MSTKKSFFNEKENHKYLTWKAVSFLKPYMTRFCDIKPRKYTGNKVNVQKKMRKVIIQGREIGLLPYTK